ncbi:MAG: exodeoxyribonuclease VII large subunit [Deferrisomatales bacterium]
MPSKTDSGWAPEPGEILTVADLVARARGLLEQTFSWVWVEGEISNARIPSSGHAYFTLGDGRAQLRAVCFRSTLRLLRLRPEDGLRVLARGRLTVYEARGDIQLVVEDMEPQGEGLARLELEALKRRLAAEGLFDEGRKRPLPPLPRAVGVVTSPTGAAIRDILQVLRRRAPGVHVYVAPARVQGEGAAEEIRRALALAGAHPEVEVVILGRGGGSAEDLGAFNDEALVRAVAACPVPVIAAVGHEIDVTLVDFAADLRAPTPSAAAELAVREWGRWADEVRRGEEALVRAYRGRIEALRHRLERADPARCSPAPRIARLRIGLDRTAEALDAALARLLWHRKKGLLEWESRLGRRAPHRRLGEVARRLQELEGRMRGAWELGAQRRRGTVSGWAARLEALSPLAVLGRGYAVVRTSSGRVVRAAAQCRPGQPLDVRVARGELGCRVEEVRDPRGEE